MDKLKKILNPGALHDDEVLYGSGQSSDPVHSGNSGTSSGQGSHFDGSSTNPTSATGYDNTTTGTGANTYGSGNTTSSSRMPGGFDDDVASTTAIRHGVPGNSQSGSTMTGSSGTNDPLDTNKPLPQAPGSTGTGVGGVRSTVGTGRDLPGSDLPGTDRGMGQSGYDNTGSGNLDSSPGRLFPLGGGSNTSGSGYGSGTGPTTGSAHQGSLGRDAAVGTGGIGAAGFADRELRGQRDTTNTGLGSGAGVGADARGYGPESWQHEHSGHGHQYEGDPCAPGETAAGPHFTSGPHTTDTANRLDPHVAGGALGGTTGTGHHHGHHETSTGAAIGSPGTGLDSSTRGYDHSRSSGTTRGMGSSGTGLGSGGADDSGLGTGVSQRAFDSTTGPASHERENIGKYNTLATGTPSGVNLGGTSSSSGSGYGSGMGSQDTGYDNEPGDRHLGRNAALAGGAGAMGAGAYEVGKDQPISTSGPAPNTTGPHKVDLMNRLDPRVKETTLSSTTGTTTRDQLPSSETTARDHHYGRDAGLAGAGGAAAYEAEKHHKKHEVPQQVTGPDATIAGTQIAGYDQPPPVGGTGHHYGRDAGLAGAGGAAAYEAEKHHKKHEVPQQVTGPDATIAGTQIAGYDQPPPVGGTGHHYGRDAGLAGAAGAAGYEGEKHLGHNTSATSTYPEDRLSGRESALAGGAGAAGGSEFSKKEAEKQQKALAKEEKTDVKAERKHEKEVHKEHSKEEKQDGKKHGLFGFLHREKPDSELKEEENARQAQAHGSAGGVSSVGGVAIAEDEYGHHKLHKEPPPGYAAAPESGYASQVTGGTGTTVLAQDEPVQRGSDISGVGNKLDPSVAGRGYTVDNSALGYQGQGSTGSGLTGIGETAGTGRDLPGREAPGGHPADYNASGEAARHLHHERQADIGLGPGRLEPDRSHIESTDLRRDAAYGGTSGFDSTKVNLPTGLGGGTTGSDTGKY